MTDIGDGDEDRAAEAGRRRREFIRTHHPDRGGDTESFIAGLRLFDTEQPSADSVPPPKVTVFARRPWPTRLVTAAARRIRHGKPASRVR
jgi:hypothetical protein